MVLTDPLGGRSYFEENLGILHGFLQRSSKRALPQWTFILTSSVISLSGVWWGRCGESSVKSCPVEEGHCLPCVHRKPAWKY